MSSQNKVEMSNYYGLNRNFEKIRRIEVFLFSDQKLYSDTVCTMYLPTFAGTSILVVNIVSGRGLSIMQTCV